MAPMASPPICIASPRDVLSRATRRLHASTRAFSRASAHLSHHCFCVQLVFLLPHSSFRQLGKRERHVCSWPYVVPRSRRNAHAASEWPQHFRARLEVGRNQIPASQLVYSAVVRFHRL